MSLSTTSTEIVTCCICLDSEGSNEYMKYWRCDAPHADLICKTCMLHLMQNSSPCPLCRARNSFSIVSILNLNNYFNNNNINDLDIINVITTLIYTRDIYHEL